MLAELWELIKPVLKSAKSAYLLTGIGLLAGGFLVDTDWGPPTLRFFYHGGWGTDFYRAWMIIPLMCGIASLLLSGSMSGAWVAFAVSLVLALFFAVTKSNADFQADPWPLLTWLSYRTAVAVIPGPTAALIHRWTS